MMVVEMVEVDNSNSCCDSCNDGCGDVGGPLLIVHYVLPYLHSLHHVVYSSFFNFLLPLVSFIARSVVYFFLSSLA